MIKAWHDQDLTDFSRLRDLLFPLSEALLLETNPSPLKFAVSLLKKCNNEVRLPLVSVSSSTEQHIRDAMRDVGLLN